jgi:hypothetical protein
MRFLKIKTTWVICILSFASALFINQINLEHIPDSQKRNGITVKTSDDVSYLKPAENYIAFGEWKDNSLGKQSYFVRPPGYGIIYYSLIKLTDHSSAPTLLKMVQITLFGISVFWLFSIAQMLFKSKRTAYVISIIYGLTPIANGFLFYTLTEGITPSILLYFVYLLFKAHNQSILKTKRKYYFFASLIFAILLLIRPQLGLFGLLIPVFLTRDYLKYGVKKTLLNILIFSLIGFSLTIIWQVRNYKIADKYVGLHAIYFEDSNSIYRPTFKAYWELTTGWAQEGHVTHSYMVPMYQAALRGDTSKAYVATAIASYPDDVVAYFGEERLTNMLIKYQQATLAQKDLYDRNLPMPSSIPEIEQDLINEIEMIVDEYQSKFWLEYYIISPMKVFKVMAFHSNLSHYIFQHTFRGNYLVEALRYFTFGIHSLSFLLLLLSTFILKHIDWRLAIINLVCILYVLYLCFVQRGIEERYTLPMLSFLIISLFYTGAKYLSFLRR